MEFLKKEMKSRGSFLNISAGGAGSSKHTVQRGKQHEGPPDLEMAQLKSDRDNLPPAPESSTAGAMKNADEVVSSRANASFQWNSTSLSSFKSKSRLMDPPEDLVAGVRRLERVGRLPSSTEVGEDRSSRGKGNHRAWTLIQFFSLVSIIALLICSLYMPALKKRTLRKLRLWKWEVLILALICGRLISGWGIKVVVFFIERKLFWHKQLLYAVYGIRKAVQNFCWLVLVLMTWRLLFDKKLEAETKSDLLRYVTKVLVCLLLGSALWLVKTLMVKMIASSFRVSAYFDRIRESLLNQFVIEKLYGLPLIENQRIEEDEERTAAEIRELQTRGKADNEITFDHLHKLNSKDISAWSMKRLINKVRHASATQFRSEFEAKAAARTIFQNVAQTGSEYICLEDLVRFMPEDEALRTMSFFEVASERRVSKSSLENWMVNAFRERRALTLTLDDTNTVVKKLHRMVKVIVSMIIGIMWLLILGIATTQILVVVSSQLLLLVFIFGDSCKTVFQSAIFLFVVHPFDVGDRCEIDGVQMVVEEMSIMSTMFIKDNNLRILIPNSTLSTKAVSNFHRSPGCSD